MIVSSELSQLFDLLSRKVPLAAMLAPSFVIDFSFPEIINQLKKRGFTYVVEVARGAIETNSQVIEELKNDPKKRVITSPCPSCVRYLRATEPDLVPFLSRADSPMRATAKLINQNFPGAKPVFIGPCLTKKLEAKEYKKLDILVITFKELVQLFKEKPIKDLTVPTADFDLLGEKTRLYPISGGLCQSAGINEFLTEEEYRTVSGFKQLKESLVEFRRNKYIRLLDILFCEGGCIGGPGIVSSAPLSKRREKVVKFWDNHLS